ncbi:MAG TPA: YbaN family protein [Methanobacterium sp.]|jgi:hypothetical protein|nr:MAG: DUF454 domain-containing protein [Methanobacterium sp.]HOI72284.1 YbaN family protein [Methanobacterium sp.]
METKRLFFLSVGSTLLGIGVIGIIIPVLPTTPFILASAFFYGKSSKRLDNWISNSPYFGSYIENYKTKNGVPLNVKLTSIGFLWLTLVVSAFLFSNTWYIPLILIIVGMAVTLHIALIKTKDNS